MMNEYSFIALYYAGLLLCLTLAAFYLSRNPAAKHAFAFEWLSNIFGPKTIFPATNVAAIDPEELERMLKAGGYTYDAAQDIFFSNLDGWQREVGYCRLYDEAAAPMGMIIDCEPIYFEYGQKRWMIELWKGQYDLMTGCEVGVYSTKGPALNIPGVFSGAFYHCASDKEMLDISYTLYRNGKALFARTGRHWWLTGFMLGEFSDPSELIMDVAVTLKDEAMRTAFVRGLKKARYPNSALNISGSTVGFSFKKPRTAQPYSRTRYLEYVTQLKNKLLCARYQNITQGKSTLPEKLAAVKRVAPQTYINILDFGKSKKLFEIFDTIKDYVTDLIGNDDDV